MPDTLEIHKCLNVSTAHITPADDELLREDSQWYLSGDAASPQVARLLVAPKFAGYFVHVEPAADAQERHRLLARGYSRAIIDLLDLARVNQCQWIVVDADGPRYDHLPQFKW